MIVLLLILGLLPGFAWLIFYVKEEETHPEPKRLIILAFAAGIVFGLIAVVFGKRSSRTRRSVSASARSRSRRSSCSRSSKKPMKFAAAYLAIGKSRIARNPVDLMIYLIIAALGFATLENVGALATFWLNAQTNGTSGAFAASFAEALSLRFVGATLLHSLTSGIVGYHWALGILRTRWRTTSSRDF